MSRKLPCLIATSVFFTLSMIASEENTSGVSQSPSEETFSKVMESSSPFSAFTGRITGSKVRLRAQPKLEGAVIRETTDGELVAVLGAENDFYVVQPPKGSKGYVFRTFILDGVVEADRVNIRLHPEIDSPVIGRLQVGEKVEATVCPTNCKWFEVELPATSRFYIAKEYIDNIGPLSLLAKMEERHTEGTHLLNSALSFCRSEIQKPYEEIDFDSIHRRLQHLTDGYSDFNDIVEKTHEATHLLEETYLQKKIAFLESKAEKVTASTAITEANLKKLLEMGGNDPVTPTAADAGVIGEAASATMGFAVAASQNVCTDKMQAWQPLEESIYHLWAATHEGHSMDEFYKEESVNAAVLSGIVEPYNRPIKNRPGDFILRSDNHPVAFLYSTKVNLQEFIGKKVTLVGTLRPNNHFAFPAYFVISVE